LGHVRRRTVEPDVEETFERSGYEELSNIGYLKKGFGGYTMCSETCNLEKGQSVVVRGLVCRKDKRAKGDDASKG